MVLDDLPYAPDKRGISALDISYKVGVTYKTAWGMLHRIRLAMAARDSHYQLAGLIQVDDVYFKGGLSKGGDKRGRGTSKVLFLLWLRSRMMFLHLRK